MSGSLSLAGGVYPDLVPLDPPEEDIATLPRLTANTIRLWRAFAFLPIEQRRWALTTGEVETRQQGDGLSIAGEIAVVVSGCLSTTAAGSSLSAQIMGPGDVVATGTAAVIEGVWLTGGEIYRAQPEAWSEKAGPDGFRHLLAAEGRRRSVLERRVVCLTHHLATARIADLFMAIHEAQPDGTIDLSQQRIGAMLGLRRTTVNGSCRILEAQGGSRTLRSRVRVVDPALLGQAACGCRHAGREAPLADRAPTAA